MKVKSLDNLFYSASLRKVYNKDLVKGGNQKVKLPADAKPLSAELYQTLVARSVDQMVVPNKDGLPELVSAIRYSASKNTFHNLNAKDAVIPDNAVVIELDAYAKLKRLDDGLRIVAGDDGYPKVESQLAYSASTNGFYDLKLNYPKLPDDLKIISKSLYTECLSKANDEKITADPDGMPCVTKISESEAKARDDAKLACDQANSRYELDIESIAYVRSLIVENADLFTQSDALEQLKLLQDQFNNV